MKLTEVMNYVLVGQQVQAVSETEFVLFQQLK